MKPEYPSQVNLRFLPTSSFLSLFQIYDSTITEKSLAGSIPLFLILLYLFPIFPSNFYIPSSLLHPAGSWASFGRFPPIFCVSYS